MIFTFRLFQISSLQRKTTALFCSVDIGHLV